MHASGKTRKALDDTLDILGVNGMSGNESDGIGDGVQRSELPWRHKDFRAYFDQVDGGVISNKITLEGRPRGRGNIHRILHQGLRISRRTAKKDLPKNWYDASWYNALSAAQRQELRAAPKRTFPTYVSYISLLSITP